MATLPAERRGTHALIRLLDLVMGDEAEAAAARLLTHFASLADIATADKHCLADLLNGNEMAAQTLIAARTFMLESVRENIERADLRSDDPALLNYLAARLSNLREETFLVMFADREGKLIREEEIAHGSALTVDIVPRTLFRRALALDCAALLLVHNHPSGVAIASEKDIVATQALLAQAQTLEIALIDHLIVGRREIYSMRRGGDL